MNPHAVQNFVARLSTVANNLVYPPGLKAAGQKILEGAEGTTSFGYSPEAWEVWRQVVRDLLDKHRWNEKFSESHLRDQLIAILHKVLAARDVSVIRQEFEALVAEYEAYAQEWTVLVPLAGVRLGMEQLELGNVVLRNVSGETAARLTERCRSIVMRSDTTTQQKHAQFDEFDGQYLQKLRGRACAEFRAVAEPTRAKELATDEARRVIDLLRLAILFLDADSGKIAIGLQGEACEDTRAVVCVASDDAAVNYTGSMVNYSVTIGGDFVQRMWRLGVFTISDLLRKPDPTEFEKVILRAVHWLSSAQAQPEKENALLNLVTCLETFLKPAQRDPITATIAEGVAILTASRLEERKRRKARIKDFYGKRSRLTHEGDGEVLQSDLDELTGIVRDLVVKMIRRRGEFARQEDLSNWIDDQKLT